MPAQDSDPEDDPTPVVLPVEDELDLHPFRPQDIRNVVDDYVTAAAERGLTEIRLVHGRGRGIQRGIVQAALEAHPLVVSFCDDSASHLGATIAMLAPRRPDGHVDHLLRP